ncbi:SusC/RagA family TonB-linked outer membrane protein [Mucilaginibacter sp. 14171R-50]|uniref:SusC/RagA family TonB-linked outer membrane protein n=1 Tax=Mucilaginibacter sp. 14171R-50 TaxID=2703789 RepID=UPI00138C73C4|nr:SusC/RagA family TonB-linked outer membrane protein [Mucilaginibacter sp. 14171R-50]QHS57502.1 SusC/RagA family TonB-linked outer membrane protein [Mucilaginibacter sp. 14171R-50]
MAKCYLNKYFTALVILMLALCTTGRAMQQDTTAKVNARPGMAVGVALDEYGNPLKGVKVSVKGKADTVSTDKNGSFEISAANNTTLVFIHPNYNVRQATVKDNRAITVRLIDTYIKTPAKIDVLYGKADADKYLGAISTVYTNQLTTTPATLYTYALPGQLSGLYTQQYSGFATPQTTPQTQGDFIGNVVLHNNYSANDNTEFNLYLRGQVPITIIDGVQREIASLDPESIESVSVLKDGFSNILLGINGSRGVLLITTKRAQAGPPRISFTAQTGLQSPLGLPTPLPAYQYAYLYNEALQNDGKLPIYSSADFNAYRDHSDPVRHPDVNWYNMLLRDNSAITSYKLNVNGGSAIARYSVSLNYLNQDGMFKTASSVPYNTNNNLSRYIINSDLTVNVTKKFVVDLQLFGRIQSGTQPGAGYNNILSGLYSTPNNAYPATNPDGSFGGTTTFTNNLLSQSQFSGYQRTNSNDVLANLDLTYDMSSVTKGLSAKAKGNLALSSQGLLNRSLQNNTFLIKPDDTYAGVGSPVAQVNNFTSISSARYAFAQVALDYDRQFGKHNVTGMLLYDTRSVNLNFDLTSTTTNEAFKAGYNYDGKYFIEGAVNRSGYSRYPPGKQFGIFYAGGLGWQMAKEDFIKDNLNFITSWKWRATYGRTGNANVDNFGYYNFIQTYGSPNGYQYSTGTSRSDVQGIFQNQLANPYISWEKADKIDIGADIALFNDHFKITADYYHDRYKDLLQIRGRNSLLLGTPYSAENIGVVLNQGEELTLTYQNNIGNFNYFISGNASLQYSKNVFSDETPSPYPWLRHTGQSTRAVYAYTALGFFKDAQEAANSATTTGYTAQAGDVKYADLNNDGVINQFDISAIANKKPLLFYGTSLGFNYKGFSFSMIIQGVKNNEFMFNKAMVNSFAGVGFLGLTYAGQGYDNLTGRWTPETASTATLPRLSLGNANNTANSTLYVRSGDYLRLKNAEIGYNLPYQWIHKFKLSGMRLFANGENLVTLYGYKGIDPEVSNGAYPIQRVVNVGVTVKL